MGRNPRSPRSFGDPPVEGVVPLSGSRPRRQRRVAQKDIFSYHRDMKIVKVRRLGDSNIVVIPREFEKLGYTPGDSVLVEALPNGEILIRPADQLRATMDRIIDQVVDEDREALQILADHDRKPAPDAPA